ncbi:MAG: hypothetical protein AAFP19_21585 [Bacteroidota bacterium]
MLQKLKQLIKPPKERPGLILAMEYQGHRLYRYPDMANMPLDRIEVFRARVDEYNNRFKRTDLKAFFQTLQNEPNINKIYQLASYAESMVDQPISYNCSLLLSAITILLDDEPESTADKSFADHEAKKLALIEKHQPIKDFFLGISSQLLEATETGLNSMQALELLHNPMYRRNEQIMLSKITSSIDTSTGQIGEKNTS